MAFYVVIEYGVLDKMFLSGYRKDLVLVRVRLPVEEYHNPPAYDQYATAARFALAAFDQYSFSKKFDDQQRPRNALVVGVFNANRYIRDMFPKDVKRLEAVSHIRKLETKKL